MNMEILHSLKIRKCVKCDKGFYLVSFDYCPHCGTYLRDSYESVNNMSEWTEFTYHDGTNLSDSESQKEMLDLL